MLQSHANVIREKIRDFKLKIEKINLIKHNTISPSKCC